MSDNFVSRKIEPLPLEECNIKIIVYTNDEPITHVCKWKPFKQEDYPSNRIPTSGYLGTAEVIEGNYTGFGYHCWEETNSEFVYYSLIQE